MDASPPPKGWAELRVCIGDFASYIRHPALTPEQQGRLALAWTTIYAAGLSMESAEQEWRLALAYTPKQWAEVRDAFELALPDWRCPMLVREVTRQRAASQKQSERAHKRWDAVACGGMPDDAKACPAVAVASAVEESKEESTPAQRPSDAARSPEVFHLPLRDGSLYGVTEADVLRWRKFYPEVDILPTLREQAAWLESNPGRRKTRRGMARFINAWLLREQEKPYDGEAPSRNGFVRR